MPTSSASRLTRERFAILEENVKKWGEGSSNRLRCVNAAASDEVERADSGEITFYTTGTQISGGLFAVAERSDAYTPRKMPLVCVDDYFEASARTFIKIDVEGAELRVLKGARRHIESGTTRFYTEISWWGDRQTRHKLDRRPAIRLVLGLTGRSSV